MTKSTSRNEMNVLVNAENSEDFEEEQRLNSDGHHLSNHAHQMFLQMQKKVFHHWLSVWREGVGWDKNPSPLRQNELKLVEFWTKLSSQHGQHVLDESMNLWETTDEFVIEKMFVLLSLELMDLFMKFYRLWSTHMTILDNFHKFVEDRL